MKIQVHCRAAMWLIFFATTILSNFVLTTAATKDQSIPGYCWSEWVNLYLASEGLDLEIFTRVAALQHGICIRPFGIDYARVDGKPVNEKLRCSFYGCTCRDTDQAPGVKCGDYKVRFLCKCTHPADGNNPTRDFFICPNGEPKEIRCSGQSIIRITKAYYGNIWFSPCGLGSARSVCREESSKTLENVAVDCNRRKECSIEPPSGLLTGGDNCKDLIGTLHVEYSCEVLARAPGNYVGKVGETYIDPTCKYKCIFLLINRAICLPVCPLHYGFGCPDGSVIRWVTEKDPFAPQCSCRKPFCLDIASSCKVGEQVFKRGERFPLACEEECICLGRNELKCVPLCPIPIAWCPARETVYMKIKHTRYPECTCEVARCMKKSGSPFLGLG